MEVFAALPILLLVAGMLTLIIYAIAKKKWALLFIPAGLMVLVVLAGLWYSMIGTKVDYSRTDDAHLASVPAYPTEYDSTNAPTRSAEYNRNTSVKVTRHQPPVLHTVEPKFGFAIFGFIEIALLALVVLVIIAIVRKKWAVLFIPLGVGGVLLIMLVARKAVHSSAPRQYNAQVRQQNQPDGGAASIRVYDDVYKEFNNTRTHSGTPSHVPGTEISPARSLPTIWSPGIEKEFRADVYYSKTAALRGIAANVVRMVKELALKGKPVPHDIVLLKDAGKPTQKLLDEAFSMFQEVLPDTKFYMMDRGEGPIILDGSWIYLQLTENTGQPIVIQRKTYGGLTDSVTGEVTGQVTDTKNTAFKNGSIKVEIDLSGRKTSYSVPFTEKPWVENFSAFKNSYPHRQFDIAYSQSSSGSSNRAFREAYDQAKRIVTQRISESTPAGRPPMNISLSNADLSRHGVVVDVFSQSLTGSSTPIYRQALLLDLSLDRIQPLAQQVVSNSQEARQDRQVARQTWAYQLFSALGIALAICVIYLILNAATKGYYTAVLRILTVIGIIVVVVVVLGIV